MKKIHKKFIPLLFGLVATICTPVIVACMVGCSNKDPIYSTSDKKVTLVNGDLSGTYNFCAINIKDKFDQNNKKFSKVYLEKTSGDTSLMIENWTNFDSNFNFSVKVGFMSSPIRSPYASSFKLFFSYYNNIDKKDEIYAIDGFSLTYQAPQKTGVIELDPSCPAQQTVTKVEGLSRKVAIYKFAIKNTSVPQTITVKFAEGKYGEHLRLHDWKTGAWDSTSTLASVDNNTFTIQVHFLTDYTAITTEKIEKLIVDMEDGRPTYEVDLKSGLSVTNA